MESTTLYYFLSTLAQALAAISALLAVFMQFKINEIRDYLVGWGITLHRELSKTQRNNEYSNYPNDYKYILRLQGDSERKSVKAIYEDIKELAKNVPQDINNERDINYVESRFDYYLGRIEKIKKLTLYSIAIAFSIIVLSLIALPFVEFLKHSIFSWIIIVIMLIMTIISLIFTFKGVTIGLENKE